MPIESGQQMYQALRSLGIDTQMVIYPNENHGISRPTYVRDRYERYLAWYDKYLKRAPEANCQPRWRALALAVHPSSVSCGQSSIVI